MFFCLFSTKYQLYFLEASDMLNSYYTRSYGDTYILGQMNTDLLMSNVDLTYTNADDVLAYAADEKFDEWEYFVEKLSDVSTEMIGFEEISSVQAQLLLLSGIAGIGKTCFLQSVSFVGQKVYFGKI